MSFALLSYPFDALFAMRVVLVAPLLFRKIFFEPQRHAWATAARSGVKVSLSLLVQSPEPALFPCLWGYSRIARDTWEVSLAAPTPPSTITYIKQISEAQLPHEHKKQTLDANLSLHYPILQQIAYSDI